MKNIILISLLCTFINMPQAIYAKASDCWRIRSAVISALVGAAVMGGFWYLDERQEKKEHQEQLKYREQIRKGQYLEGHYSISALSSNLRQKVFELAIYNVEKFLIENEPSFKTLRSGLQAIASDPNYQAIVDKTIPLDQSDLDFFKFLGVEKNEMEGVPFSNSAKDISEERLLLENREKVATMIAYYLAEQLLILKQLGVEAVSAEDVWLIFLAASSEMKVVRMAEVGFYNGGEWRSPGKPGGQDSQYYNKEYIGTCIRKKLRERSKQPETVLRALMKKWKETDPDFSEFAKKYTNKGKGGGYWVDIELLRNANRLGITMRIPGGYPKSRDREDILLHVDTLFSYGFDVYTQQGNLGSRKDILGTNYLQPLIDKYVDHLIKEYL